MPLPVAAVPPAAGAFCAGAAAASKHLVFHAAPLLDITTLSYATVGAWLLRYVWKNKIPKWAKEDVSLKALLRRKKSNEKEAKGIGNLTASQREEVEMSNVSSILEKLQALVKTVQLDDDHPSMLQQHAALLAFIQLAAQVKRDEQLKRDSRNESFVATFKDEEKKGESDEWTSRDSLYQNSRVDSPTIDSLYYRFAANPKKSPLMPALQRALLFSAYAYYDDAQILLERLENEDCSLLEHSLVSPRPGCVAYYLAVSSIAKKQLILGIRGTSTLEDMVTDCCGRSVPLDDRPYYYDHDRGTRRNRNGNFLDPSRIEVQAAKSHEIINNQDEVEVISGLENIKVEHERNEADVYDLFHCHEGCMVSAKRLANTIQEQVEHWVLQRGYQLVIAGHSLGAGVASLTAAILRSRLPELTDRKRDTPSMHVYCFAPPPILDRETALAACSYTTSVVYNADMIPRCSMENLLVFLEILKGVWKQLQQKRLAPTNPKSTAAFFQSIAKGSEGDMLMTPSSLRTLMRQSMEKVQLDAESKRLKAEKIKQAEVSCDGISPSVPARIEDPKYLKSQSTELAPEEAVSGTKDEDIFHPGLYVPGVVLLGYEAWQGSGLPGESSTSFEDTSDNEEYPTRETETPYNLEWIVTNGTARALRFLEIDASPRIFFDHTTTSYYSLLDMEYQF